MADQEAVPADHVAAERLAARAELEQLTHRLVADYAGRVSAGSVLRAVSRAYESLRQAGVNDDVVASVEVLVRLRLDRRFSAHSAA